MTAFDNIKTNNWPATSNASKDFEQFNLPLQSSIEDTPTFAGSRIIRPARTVTQTAGSAGFLAPAGTNVFNLERVCRFSTTDLVTVTLGSELFNSTSWTLEYFFYPTATSLGWYLGTSTSGNTYNNGWSIELQSGNLNYNYDSNGASQRTLHTGVSANTWYFHRLHVAVGGTITSRLFTSPSTQSTSTVTGVGYYTVSTGQLKIGDANGNANNLANAVDFANIRLFSGAGDQTGFPLMANGIYA